MPQFDFNFELAEDSKGFALRIAMFGPSGSGKTFTALNMAQHMGQKIAVIDSEKGSAKRYARYFKFYHCDLKEYHPKNYVKAINAAQQNGFDVIITDSLSHTWLEMLQLAGKGKGLEGWKDVNPLERELLDTIVDCKSHLIVTMRTKTDYQMEEYIAKDGRTKTAPKKVGLAPVMRNDFEYEFDIVLQLDTNHCANVIKSRCLEITDKTFVHPGKELADLMLNWANGDEVKTSEPVFEQTTAKEQNKPTNTPKTQKVSAPKPPQIWDTWKSQKDRDDWALSILPDAEPEFLSRFFTGLKASGKDEKGALIVQSVMDFQKFGGYEKIKTETEQSDDDVETDSFDEIEQESVESQTEIEKQKAELALDF